MSELLNKATRSVAGAKAAWCRYITGNDAGTTGSHQAGFYVPKAASAILFETPGVRGENKEKTVRINWQNDFVTESQMKYYGQGTRNEYRITRFGRNFPFLQDDSVGSLLILCKYTEEDYEGYVLQSDEDIDGFLSYFSLSPTATNQLIDIESFSPGHSYDVLFDDFAANFNAFPETRIMAEGARKCYNQVNRISTEDYRLRPDELITGWVDTELELFRRMEERVEAEILTHKFDSVAEFVEKANQVLNRRKARAGKSLEHHLADVFTHNQLIFEEQGVTEDNKKPDFLFPNSVCYHNMLFPADDLTVLGAKTTCKDRWRQVLTEADRVDEKFLFTLQPAISRNQLKEMHDSRLTLVVPQNNISSFPKEYQSQLLTLTGFVHIVSEKQSRISKHYLL